MVKAPPGTSFQAYTRPSTFCWMKGVRVVSMGGRVVAHVVDVWHRLKVPADCPVLSNRWK